MSPADTTVQEEYVAARRALLDALMALETQRAAIVLAGAQAIYVRTGGGSLPISDFTSDGDLALDPACLAETPTLGESMENADFKLATRGGAEEPGIWEKDATFDGQPGKVQIDLIVPTEIAPPGGTRGARLPFHGKRAARKVSGLEGCDR